MPASTSPSPDPPCNVAAIFLAQFDVRTGNEITFQSPKGYDLSGVEFKALPSGTHLVTHDTIYFDPPASKSSRSSSLGIASFRNVKLPRDERNGQAGPAGSSTAGAGVDQRGARMLSVGVVLACASSSPSVQLEDAMPHFSHLEELADALSEHPERHDLLDAYLAQCRHDGQNATNGSSSDRGNAQYRRISAHHPVLHLPAISSALGPLLPTMIKRLLLPGQRLLIYSSAPLRNAAWVAYNLAEFVNAARTRRKSTANEAGDTGVLRVRGVIGLHDLTALENEQRSRSDLTEEDGWIAFTSDKLLLEKPHLYDLLLDLTPLLPAPGQIHAHAPAKLPRLMHVERTPAPKQLKLKGDMWTTRDFAVFRELDAQATRRAERTRRRLRRRSSRSTMRSEDHDSDFRPPGDETSRYGTLDLTHQRERNGSHRTGLLATLLAFVRYWLAGWWIFPQNWALSLPSSYVLPLGIRGDGGVRASMLLLPESDSEASDLDDEDQEDDNYTEETHAEPVEDLQVEYDEQESEDGSVEEDEAPPDPLLAACGANIASRAPRHRAPAAADIFVAESQSSNPSRSTRRSAEHIFATGEASASSAQTSLDPRLAQALRSIWSRWVCGLLNAIDGLVAERMDASNPADKNGVVLGPSDMACLGLSASSAFDAHLLQTLAEESANGPIVVDRGWAILRWWT